MRARDWATVDFYAVLGVEPTATSEDIGLAFRSLAKQLHPDRVGALAAESERFKSVTAAYDVLGNPGVRRSYDEVRFDAVRAAAASPGLGSVAPGPRPGPGHATSGAKARPPATAETLRRRGRRWIGAGLVVTLVGIVVAALVVHLQVSDSRRRAGRLRAAATLLVTPGQTDITFRTAAGTVVRTPEPPRVNPGAERNGMRVTVLYRPADPTDVIFDESAAARDITLWIVALKMLVGGPVFLGVGIRRLRQAAHAPAAAVSSAPTAPVG